MKQPQLTIDLAALAENYRRVQQLSHKAEAACVVKADAYGLGMEVIAPALARAGAKTFFVATLSEGIQLRALLKDVTIYIFNGLAEPLAAFAQHNLRPCLSSSTEIALWDKEYRALPAAIHIDTGINRLGLSLDDWRDIDFSFTPALLMTHCSSADQSLDPENEKQRQRFIEATQHYNVPKSMANSAGLFLSDDFHFQMTRAGIALYGGNPISDNKEDKFLPVVSLTAPIAQIRKLKSGEKVGYGCSWQAQRTSTIGVITLGYGDGYPRHLTQGRVFANETPCPIVGRISMDMLCVDITDALTSSDMLVELIGKNITINELAAKADTIPHHILTSLGKRTPRFSRQVL